MLTNKILIFEHKKPSVNYINRKKNFIFTITEINYFKNFNKSNFTVPFKADEYSLNHYLKKFCFSLIDINEPLNKYESLAANQRIENIANYNQLFKIRDYFSLKYGIKIYNKTYFNLFKTSIEYKNKLTNLLLEEINYFKANLNEVYDKSEVINRFGYLFTKCEPDNNNDNVPSKNNNYYSYNNSSNLNSSTNIVSRYDLIMKKRAAKKKKLINKSKDKELNLIEDNKKSIKKTTETNIDLSLSDENNDSIKLNRETDYSKDTSNNIDNKDNSLNIVQEINICNYCNKDVNQSNCKYCNSCKKAVYCNDICLNKDFKFHKRKCNINNN